MTNTEFEVRNKVAKHMQANPNTEMLSGDICKAIMAQYTKEWDEAYAVSENKVGLSKHTLLNTRVTSCLPKFKAKGIPIENVSPHPRDKIWKYTGSTDIDIDALLAKASKAKSIKDEKSTDKRTVNQREKATYAPSRVAIQHLVPMSTAYTLNDHSKTLPQGSTAGDFEDFFPDQMAKYYPEYEGLDLDRVPLAYMQMQPKLAGFENKLECLSIPTARKYMYNANSKTWAFNLRYLIVTELPDEDSRQYGKVMDFLRLESMKYHGLGVILLDVDNPTNSQIVVEAIESPLNPGGINLLYRVCPDFASHMFRIVTGAPETGA